MQQAAAQRQAHSRAAGGRGGQWGCCCCCWCCGGRGGGGGGGGVCGGRRLGHRLGQQRVAGGLHSRHAQPGRPLQQEQGGRGGRRQRCSRRECGKQPAAAAAPLGTSRHRQHEMEGRPSRPASAPPHRLGGRLEGWAGCRDRGGGAGARVSMIAGLCSRFHQATSTRARQREPHLYAC